jgi:hypothetical protein
LGKITDCQAAKPMSGLPCSRNYRIVGMVNPLDEDV